MRRSLETARAADLVLWLSETGEDPLPPDFSRENVVGVRTKADLGAARATDGALAISSKTGEGLDRSVAAIAERARATVGDFDEPLR